MKFNDNDNDNIGSNDDFDKDNYDNCYYWFILYKLMI